MYWIYLVIFVLAVFSPEIIHKGLFFFDHNLNSQQIRMFEELAIFFLGTVGFLMYLWKEKQLKMKTNEKSQIQQEISQISKDLKNSYSYIGEINRKLDIMKNIALGFPRSGSIKLSGKDNSYKTIIEALKVFSKTKKFTIRIVNSASNNTKKEIKGDARMEFKIKNNSLKLMKKENFFKNDDYYVFRSRGKINNIRTYIIIQREKSNQIEDPGIINTLATQVLFLYTLSTKFKIKV
ncbi:hypothetical protein ACFLY1_00590 [Patescibacteria group bacterium]